MVGRLVTFWVNSVHFASSSIVSMYRKLVKYVRKYFTCTFNPQIVDKYAVF